MAAERLSCLARNGRASVPRALFLARGREPRGRKSRRRHCGKAIEAPAVLGPDHAIEETARVACQTASGEKTWWTRGRARGGVHGAKERKHWRTDRPHRIPEPRPGLPPCRHRGLSAADIALSDRSAAGTAPFTTSLTADTRRTPNRRHDEARLQRSLAGTPQQTETIKPRHRPPGVIRAGLGAPYAPRPGRIKPNR
jgi:hypothetical protein